MVKKKAKLPTKTSNSNKTIPSADRIHRNYDAEHGRVIFSQVDDHKKCSIDKIQGSEFKLLIKCFKLIESLTWNEIQKHPSLKFEINDNTAIPRPSGFPPDTNLCSMRISSKFRIYGYRVQQFFYIVWFDRKHEVCPMGKSKSYTA